MRKRTIARILALSALFQVDVGGIHPAKAMENVFFSIDDEVLGIFLDEGKEKGILRKISSREKLRGYLDDEKFRSFADELFSGVLQHIQELDASIEEKLKNWKYERVAKVEKNILRLALFEMLYRDDIPVEVSIDEAVELAKIFGDRDSGRFVNGILGAIKGDEVKEHDRSEEA
ncbi:MAG: transcription antitermination factor NusB [Candidatus Eremiobacteraeota bacterium]|nr:transcription antitermination factor NusB [Candidatus Eremiobacteraeota bacterium]